MSVTGYRVVDDKTAAKKRQELPIWQHAEELLMLARDSGTREDIRDATDQVQRALQVEGWRREAAVTDLR